MKTIQILSLTFLLLCSCTVAREATQKISVDDAETYVKENKFKYFFYEGVRLKEERIYDQAIECFRMCQAIDSADTGALAELGVLYTAMGMKYEGLVCMEKAYHLDSTNWWYGMNLVSFYSNLDLSARAVRIAEDMQRVFPNKEMVYYMLGSLYKDTKAYTKALKAYDTLEQISGVEEDIVAEKYGIYKLLGKERRATTEIEKLVKKYPGIPRFKVFLGDVYFARKKTKKAFEVFQEVLASHPEESSVYLSLSKYYQRIGNSDKEKESILSALRHPFVDVNTKMSILGEYVESLMNDTTKFDETESLFRLLIESYPLEENVYAYYQSFLQYRNRIPEAIQVVESMLILNPSNKNVWQQLVQLATSEKLYAKALETCDRAMTQFPQEAQWFYLKGLVFIETKELDSAIVQIKKAIPLLNQDQVEFKSELYGVIGDLYYRQEKNEDAFSSYEEALKINPQNLMVLNNYAYYLSELKKELKKAEKMSAFTIDKDPTNSTFLDTYAWILYQQENYSLAKFYIERAVDNLKKESDPGVILEHYGDILWKMNETRKALEIWKKSYDSGLQTDSLKKKIKNKGM